MNDLISRQALIEDIRRRVYIDKALAEIFETVIDEQPVAFDFDRTIEKLNEQKAVWEDETFKERKLAEEHIKAFNMAIRIVSSQLNRPLWKNK